MHGVEGFEDNNAFALNSVVLVVLVFPIAMARWLVGYGLKWELQSLLLSKHS